jgi:hypothetical protein
MHIRTYSSYIALYVLYKLERVSAGQQMHLISCTSVGHSDLFLGWTNSYCTAAKLAHMKRITLKRLPWHVVASAHYWRDPVQRCDIFLSFRCKCFHDFLLYRCSGWLTAYVPCTYSIYHPLYNVGHWGPSTLIQALHIPFWVCVCILVIPILLC